MRVVLDLTPGEYRAAHDLIGYALNRSLEDDPDVDELRSFYRKLLASKDRVLCSDCRQRRVYVGGRCQACYRAQKRKAS